MVKQPPLCAAALGCALSYYGLYLAGAAGVYLVLSLLFLAGGILAFFESLASLRRLVPPPEGAPGLPRRRRHYTAAFAAGLALGLAAHYGAPQRVPRDFYAGLPAKEITGLEGRLLDDPRSIQGRNRVYGTGGMEIQKAYGRNVETRPGGRIPAPVLRVFFDEEALPRLAEFGRKSLVYVEGSFEGDFFRARGVHILAPAPGPEKMRSALRMGLLEKFSPHEWGPLAQAVILGVRDNLDTSLSKTFNAAGCAHVLALSGMHLGILAALLSLLLKRPLGMKGAGLAGALLILLYVYLVGPQASLVRSLIMYLAGFLIMVRGFPRRGGAILGGAFLVQIVLFPASGGELSFTLSYLALLGLLSAGPRFYELIRGRLPGRIAGPLSASAGAFTLTSPLCAASFGVLRPVGIAAALIITPLITLFMVLALAWLLLDFLAPAAAFPLAALLSLVYRTLTVSAGAAALFPPLAAGAVVLILPAAMALLWAGQVLLASRKRLEPFD
jgi:competence protein ComEC